MKRRLSAALALIIVGTQAHAARLVAVGGDVTEIVYQLGHGAELVAVDSTSQYPAEATRLPQVGYLRQLSAEGIAALAPDRLLLSAEAGPPASVAQLRRLGIDVRTIPAEKSPQGLVDKVRAVAAAIGEVERGEQLASALQQRLGAPPTPHGNAVLLMDLGGKGLQVAGSGTAGDAILTLAGLRNNATALQGYRPVSSESLALWQPDWLVTTDLSVRQLGGVRGLLARAGLPHFPPERVITVDTMLLLGFGPRLPEAVEQLRSATQARSAGRE